MKRAETRVKIWRKNRPTPSQSSLSQITPISTPTLTSSQSSSSQDSAISSSQSTQTLS